MEASVFVIALAVTTGSIGQSFSQAEIDEQNKIFERWRGEALVWKLDELPTQGKVPDYKVPYSGDIYPDTGGGTVRSLQKYDMAFNGRRYLATRHEQWDTSAFQETVQTSRPAGLFGMRRRMVSTTRTPYWHGHCNGWAAATIRHAEPQKSVVRNGVTFRPSDIKALLAEIYIYQEVISLSGEYGMVNPGMLHVALSNWIGRHHHALAMEAVPGREKWNYPIYSYTSKVGRRNNRQAEVVTTITYANYSSGERDVSPKIPLKKHFHYLLDLNENGEVVAGRNYRDSSVIDLLWVPYPPVQGRQPGNERGNPYVDVDEVVAIWRDSVSDELAQKWDNMQDHQPPEVTEEAPQVAADGEQSSDDVASSETGDAEETSDDAMYSDVSSVATTESETHDSADADEMYESAESED